MLLIDLIYKIRSYVREDFPFAAEYYAKVMPEIVGKSKTSDRIS